jgi:hypothetical protein
MKLLGDLLTKPENVNSLTWGNEKATNEFSGVRNVILARNQSMKSEHEPAKD